MPEASQFASRATGRWPLVGRQAELRRVVEAWTRGESSGVAIVGAAGVGKSRLAWECCAALAAEGAHVERAQATASAAAVPLAAVAELVPDEVRSDDVLATMRRCSAHLRALAVGRPAVVCVDDAQLLDPVSASLVLHLAESASAFVLTTIRRGDPCPDAITSLWRGDLAIRVELAELDDEQVRRLLETALGDPVQEAATRWATEVGGGNALYLRELIGGAVASGALVHDAGLWHLQGRPRAPQTLVELVEERLAGLTDLEREAVELLALAEPLDADQLIVLTSEPAVLSLEARGLVAGEGRDAVRLAHPLYGECVREQLAGLRARALRTRLVAVLERGQPSGPDAILRIVRLRLDAGLEVPPALAVATARAANRAGDPELGVELAALAVAAGERRAGAMLLAQSHAMRNRYAEAEAALAEVEPLVAAGIRPDDPHGADDYLRQRLSILSHGLQRPSESEALIARARGWSTEPPWQYKLDSMAAGFVEREGFGDREQVAEILANDRIPLETRRMVAVSHRLTLLSRGDGEEAAAGAFAAELSIPLRDDADAVVFSSLARLAFEAGHRLDDLRALNATAVREAVRADDHQGAGLAATGLAQHHFLQGRYRDAGRWLAEADVHLRRHDQFSIRTVVRVLSVGVALFRGDFDGGTAALSQLRAWVAGEEPPWVQQPLILLGEGWGLWLRSSVAAGRRLLDDAERIGAETPGLAPLLAYQAFRAGAAASALLDQLAERVDARLVRAYAAHARGRASQDGPGLLEVAEEFAAIGTTRYAVEAASDGAAAFVAAGRSDSGRRAAARARELFVDGQDARLPKIDGLDAPAVELTPREAQLIDLARQGLTNADIADRLVLSIRTVETHIYRGMQKLGVSDRRDL
jgi:DNA-binding CsgD family transcriptional regulator